jgi:hypothetical protein
MERAVRMVFESREQYESQWAAIVSIAGKTLHGRDAAALGTSARM